jgi:multidrug efflux pump subunit AcrB
MSFVRFIEGHSRTILVVAFALSLGGAIAAFSLAVGLFPQVTFPRIRITVDAGDRPADQMALMVTRKVEEAVRQIPGVQDLKSTSSRGSAELSVDFGWGRDMIAATLNVNAALQSILPQLPKETQFIVKRMDPNVFTIIAYSLTSDTLSPVDLKDIALYQITPLLTPIPGVARVEVQGGAVAEIQVLVDPLKLDAFGLALTDVSTAITNGNSLTALGKVEDFHKLYLVMSNNTMNESEQIRDTVVRADPRSVVRVRDVAEVVDGTLKEWVRTFADRKVAVLFQIYEQPDGNAVDIAGQVRDKLNEFAKTLPAGVRLANWYDQSVLVVQSAKTVRDAVLIGLLLSAVVLFLFLRSWSTILVAVIVVPATLLSSVLLLSALGQSFNIMTLGGIAAAVGLIIDDVIVMVEHIARRAGAPNVPGGPQVGRGAVLPAGQEFMPPLTGSSLATMIVFVPLGFLSGLVGAFAKALSITMGCALGISYLMAAFVVPILCRYLINFETYKDPGAEKSGWFNRSHAYLLDGLFARPWMLVVLLLPVLGIGYYAYQNVPTGFMPAADEGGFVFDYYTLPGTSLAETERQMKQVDAIIANVPEIDTISRRTGYGLGGDLFEPNHGDMFLRLKTPDEMRKEGKKRRRIDKVIEEINNKVSQDVPGIEIELAQIMEDLIGDLTAVPEPIEVRLFADDPAKLIPQALQLAELVEKVQGVTEVKSGVVYAGDALNIQVDPVKASLEGMAPQDIATIVDSYIEGTVATTLPLTIKTVDVRVMLPEKLRRREQDILNLPIRAPDGHIFPLYRVASVTPETGQPEINRRNLQRTVAITGRIEGRDLGSTLNDLKRVLDAPQNQAPGVTYVLGGLYEQQQLAFAALTRVFIAALIAEVILLLFLYERFWLPLIIITTSLLSTSAVFVALWLTKVELNITALMGMTMIIGISTEMAIFYVSEYTELLHTMSPREALREAARNRLRPITMTTLAAIVTLMPLALAIGEGADVQQPLAIAICAGLALQFPTVLLAVPVLIGLTLRRQERTAAPMPPVPHGAPAE